MHIIRPHHRHWFASLVLVWLMLGLWASPACGITTAEVEAFQADLQATPTDGTNAQSRFNTAEAIRTDLQTQGEDVSFYEVAFLSRAQQEAGGGDLPAAYQTVHSYGLAVARHFLTGALALGNQTATEAAHPHVLFTGAEVADVRAPDDAIHQAMLDVNATSVTKYVGTQALPYADIFATGHPEDPWREYGNRLTELAFRAVITQDPGDIAFAKQWLFDLIAYPHWGNEHKIDQDLAAAQLLVGTSLAYDWLFEHLTPQERIDARRQIANHAILMHSYAAGFKNVWWRTAWTHNHHSIDTCGLAIAGYALRGEVAEAEEWIATARQLLQGTLDALAAEADGSYHEGPSYWSYILTFLLLHEQAVEVNDGQDLIADHPWLRNTLAFRLYTQYPSHDKVLSYSDGYLWDWTGPQNVMRRLAAKYRFGWGEWLARMTTQNRGANDPVRQQFVPYEYLWYDATLAPEPPLLPPSRLFPNMDLAVLRSGWDPDATVIALKSSSPGGRAAWQNYVSGAPDGQGLNAGHNHPNQNAITIYAHGAVLLAPPGYPNGPNFTHQHSTVAVDAVGQVGEGTVDYPVDVVAVDNSIGEITTYHGAPDYDFVLGDAGASYPVAKGVQRVARALLFIKPELVVLADEVRLGAPLTVHNIFRRYESPFAKGGQFFGALAPTGPVIYGQVLEPLGITTHVGSQLIDAVAGNPPYYYAALQPPATAAHTRFISVLSLRASVAQTWPLTQLNASGTDAVRVSLQDGNSVYRCGIAFMPGSATAASFGLAGDVGVVHTHSASGVVLDYFLGGGTLLQDATLTTTYVSAGAPVTLQAVRETGVLHVATESSGTSVTLYAPGASTVNVNGASVPFSTSGDTVTLTLP